MMHKKCLLSLASIAIFVASAAHAAPATPTQNAPATAQQKEVNITPEDILKVSEAFGNFIGRNLKAPGVNFDLDSIIKGMRDGYAGKPSPMSDKEYEEMMAKIQEMAYRQLSTENLKAANAFMEQNKKADKVIEIVPGKLQYLILQPGTGATVEEHNSPQIHYVGKFLDGSTFGSSQDAGGPITIPLDQTIPGFSKGLLGMKEGEKRKLFVHPDLGYGTSGHLPPNSLLIFEVEVIKANAPETNKASDSDELSFGDDSLYEDDTADADDDDFDDDEDDMDKP